MTVQELIDDMTQNTFSNEKEYSLDVKDDEGNTYRISHYDWCDQTLIIEKEQ